MNREKNSWQKNTAKLFCLLFAIIILGIIMKYAGHVLIAVGMSLAVAVGINRAAARLSKLVGGSKKIWAFLLFFGLFASIGGVLIFCIVRLTGECERLIIRLSENKAEIILFIEKRVSSIEELLRFGEGEAESTYISELLPSLVNGILSELVKSLGGMLSRLLHLTPTAVMSAFAFLVSCFYLTLDFDKMRRALINLIPENCHKGLLRLESIFVNAIVRYLRAYVLIFLMTFSEVLAGLLILRIPYAVILSVAVATVDILPVFGSGAVLIPMSAIMFFTSNSGAGVGLLILYGIITVIRQIAEPHIVGKGLGLHPLLSFLLMLSGMSFFGILGAVMFPFAAVVLHEVFLTNTKKCIDKNKKMLFTNR